MNLNINTKTKNLILLIAAIVSIAALLLLPVLVVSQGTTSMDADALDFLFDDMWEEFRSDGTLAVIGTILAIVGSGAAIYFSLKSKKAYFLYASIAVAVGNLFYLINAGDWNSKYLSLANAGFGVWLSFIASLLCIAGCFVKANDEQ